MAIEIKPLPSQAFKQLQDKNVAFMDDESSRNLNYDFNGIVKLNNCSGALVRFTGMPLSKNALVFTNGHCVTEIGSFLKPGEVVTDLGTDRPVKIYNINNKLKWVRAQSLVYATMTGTDLAIYELNRTYADLESMGISAFTLKEQHPTVNTQIDIVSGYWDRGYRCFIDGFVYDLREGDWTFTDSIRYSKTGCETIGGTSGSPIIEYGTRNVIGINNTSNQGGRACTINNPCEVNQQGQVSSMKRSYGQQTYQVYGCLTADYVLDLHLPSCTLAR